MFASTSLACYSKVDLAFVMGGCGAHSFDACAQFAKSVISGVAVEQPDMRVGVVLFSRKAKVLFGFKDFGTLGKALHALDHIRYRAKKQTNSVNLGRALKFVRDKLFTRSRSGARRTLVLLTGAKAADDVITPARLLRADGVEIFGVGLGKGIGVDQLEAVASQPVAKHVFTQGARSQPGVLRSLRSTVCRSKCAVQRYCGFSSKLRRICFREKLK